MYSNRFKYCQELLFESYCELLLPLYLGGGGFFLIKRNMNNITHKRNAFLNINDLNITNCYNHVLAKIIIFVMSSILNQLCIVRSANSQNGNINVTTNVLKFSS